MAELPDLYPDFEGDFEGDDYDPCEDDFDYVTAAVECESATVAQAEARAALEQMFPDFAECVAVARAQSSEPVWR